MRLRRAYYDLFASIYDRVIALHSGDASARLRDLLIDRTGVRAGGMLLDLCSGTGAPAPLDAGVIRNLEFARDEVPFLRRFFVDLRSELSPTGRSKHVLGN
ncbi:MAG: Methyltransferase type 11 [Chromatiaceae bacterium]|nr:Methyltransferase type 11 [Chromatiaceae bacterium]